MIVLRIFYDFLIRLIKFSFLVFFIKFYRKTKHEILLEITLKYTKKSKKIY